MSFSDAQLNEIRGRIDLVAFIGRDLDLKKASGGFVGLCPLHQEKTPSFHVSPQRGTWKCFGCNEGGDVFGYVMGTKGQSFPDAVRSVAAEVGVEVESSRARAAAGGGDPGGSDATGRSPRPTGGGGGGRRGRDATPEERRRKPPVSSSSAEVRQIGDAKGAKVVETYDYRTRKGRLIYQVVRMEPKSFRQRRPWPGREADWVWTMKAHAKSGLGEQETWLYRFPELSQGLVAEDPVWVCFAPDTEILTADGWVNVAAIRPDTHVANYWQGTERITFGPPAALQTFWHDGEMVDLSASSRWCRLSVTPDHRMLSGYKKCQWRTLRADQLRSAHRLPVAGKIAEGLDMKEPLVRLIAAWQADGVDPKRGLHVSFRLKTIRKLKRLRALLGLCAIPYTEHVYPSCEAWTSVNIMGADFARVRSWVEYDGPDKRFRRDVLVWSGRARRWLLDELGEWDGDRSGDRAVRFFTASASGANLVTEIAARSGYGSILRRDLRPERPDQREQFIVNLIDATERVLGHTPPLKPYRGLVHCLTVESGFVIARRLGAVTIAGQCEGEKDVEALMAADQVATCNSGGAGKWRDDLAEPFRGFRGHVRIVQDRDEPGEKHAQQVLASLSNVVDSAAVVVIVEPAVGKDAADHLGAGRSVEDFVQVWPLPEDLRHSDPQRFKRIMLRKALESGGTVLGHTQGGQAAIPDQPLFEAGLVDLVRPVQWQGCVVLSGEPSTGKTYVATSTSIDAALAGWDVFYLACEMAGAFIQDRAARAQASAGVPAFQFVDPQRRQEMATAAQAATLPDRFHLVEVGIGVTVQDVIEFLAEHVTERPTLTVVDSVSSFVDNMGGSDQRDSFGMANLVEVTRWITGVSKLSHGQLAFLLLSELNKESRPKGRFLDHRCNFAVAMTTSEEEGQDQVKAIRTTKSWHGPVGKLGDFVLWWQTGRLVRVSD